MKCSLRRKRHKANIAKSTMDPVIEYYNFGSANKLCSNFSVIITHLAVIWEKTSELVVIDRVSSV